MLLMRLAFLMLATGCATAPSTGVDPTHRQTTTIRLVDGGLRPTGDVTIPAMSSVVFHNATGRAAVVAIEAATCFACETVVGFEPATGGVRSVSIPPDGVASICFHEPGSHAFAFASAGNDQRGRIAVGEAR